MKYKLMYNAQQCFNNHKIYTFIPYFDCQLYNLNDYSSGQSKLSKDRKILLTEMLKRKTITSIIMFCLLFLTTSSYACSCAMNTDSIEEIYNDAEGIYYVAISSINMSGDTGKGKHESHVELDVELTVYHTFKGVEVDRMMASGFGDLPFVNRRTDFHSICGMNFSFGKEFIIVKHANKTINIGLCSQSILKLSDWEELEKFKKKNRK